uniref:Serine/threonine-protein kinase haspin n=1 Tax=Geospiza parvula TaxID=87175 RepID=A0A8C3NQ80_GEOPR
MPLQPRLLRTYSRRAGYLRPLPPPDRWISPPQDRKRLFSSTSAASSAASSALSASSAGSTPSDDPDFSPPGKRPLQALGKRPAWARRLRTRRKENRGPAGKENRKPENRERETRGRGKENREPPGKKKQSQGKEPRGRREEPRRSPPSLSSPSPCPSPSPPRGSRRRRQGPLCAARPPLLCSTPQWAPLRLSSTADSASAPGDSPPPRRRRRSPLRLSSLLLSTTIEGGSALGESRSQHRLPRGSPEACSGQRPSLLSAGEEVPEWFRAQGSARSCEPQPGLRGSRRVLRSAVRGNPARHRLHTRLRPRRRKNKRRQQPNNSLFRLQTRQKLTRRGALELSVGVRDNDSSLLNNSYSWARVRASLSFHKKKKVTTDESFCSSILCTPSGKSQLSGYQASLSAGRAQGCSWFASSMVLLAPRDSSSVLELLLTDAEKVFGECNQEGPIAFEECIPLNKMKECKKIGEGVFGEVFQIDSERGPVALKIIPIEGTEKVNGEAQKSFGEILPEVIISKELSLLSEGSVNRTVGFISLYSVHCVQGAYPRYLLEAWDKFHKETGSENDRPDFFGAQQLFMVLEFEFGGRDLERMRSSFSSVASARSILHQVTASLAVAEQELHFEHRDLHWGNVLVRSTELRELQYVLNGEAHSIPTAGLHVNIIDYTLSRLEKDGLTVFCDLSTDLELFQGTGDPQFDIYRQMKEENSNSWTDYHPHSNVLWLHYLADKLLKAMSYKRKATTPALKKIKMQLSKFHKEVLTFGSALDVLHHSSLFQ